MIMVRVVSRREMDREMGGEMGVDLDRGLGLRGEGRLVFGGRGEWGFMEREREMINEKKI